MQLRASYRQVILNIPQDMGLRHVLVVIRCLLIEPFPESALNEEAC